MTDIEPILERLGLLQYYEVFTDEGFDTWETLLDIQENDLEALGVKLGHRRKLQRAIAEHRGYSTERPLGSPPQDATVQEPSRHELGAGSSSTSREQASPAIAEPKRKYRRHPKPDEHAPEKPPSAYVIFSNRIREEVKHENLSFTETARLVGERWQKLNAAQREPFESYATSLKERYNAELAEYKRTDAYKEYTQYLADFKAKHGATGEKAEVKRPKLEAEQGSGRASASSMEHIEAGSYIPLHAREGLSGSYGLVPHNLQAGSGSTTLQALTGLPGVPAMDRHRPRPFAPERQRPGDMVMPGSISENVQAAHLEQGRRYSHITDAARSPPAGTSPSAMTARRSDGSDTSYSTGSPAWSRHGTGGHTRSTTHSESPTKTRLPSQPFTTSPEELAQDWPQEARRASHNVFTPPHQSQRQPQSPTKGSLPISHLVEASDGSEQRLSNAQRTLPFPYSSAGSQMQPTSTIYGQPSVPAMVSPFPAGRERGALPHRHASNVRRRSDDEADPQSGSSEVQTSSRTKNPRTK